MNSTNQIIVTSANIGALSMMLLFSMWDLTRFRTTEALRNACWLVSVMLYFALYNGWILLLVPDLDPWLYRVGQLLAGPVLAGMSCAQTAPMLTANARDQLAFIVWQATAASGVLLALLCLTVPHSFQQPLSHGITMTQLGISAFLCVRVGLRGDNLAWLYALVTLTGMGALSALDREATGMQPQAWVQWLLSVGLMSLLFYVMMLGRQRINAESLLLTKLMDSPEYDPLTRLYNGPAIVRKLVKMAHRHRWLGGVSAIVMVKILNTEAIQRQEGSQVLNEVFIKLASRLQAEVGSTALIGRYYDGCFIVLIDNALDSDSLTPMLDAIRRKLGEPLPVRKGENTEPIVPLIGVSLKLLNVRTSNVDTLLYEAQKAAEADGRL